MEPPDKENRMERDRQEEPDTESKVTSTTKNRRKRFAGALSDGFKLSSAGRTESIFLLSAWLLYLVYTVSTYGNLNLKGATWS